MTSNKQQPTDEQAPDRPEAYGVPQPPQIEKKWTFKKVQLIGMPVIFLIPLLAILGLFGASSTTASASGERFAVEINYPARYRYKMSNPLTVRLENLAAQTVPTVTVSFDRDYIAAFSAVSFTPAASEVTDDAYYVQLTDVQPGEVRLVVVEMQAEQYWWHEGMVAIAAGGVQEPADVAIDVRTLVYP